MTELCPIDVSIQAAWIREIPFSDWPKQASGCPAMVTDPGWHDFARMTDQIVGILMQSFPEMTSACRMLSVVLPGDAIPEHTDPQPKEWRARVHVPLCSNPQALFSDRHLEVGKAYLIDTRTPHSVSNDGETPRVHFIFDVVGG